MGCAYKAERRAAVEAPGVDDVAFPAGCQTLHVYYDFSRVAGVQLMRMIGHKRYAACCNLLRGM